MAKELKACSSCYAIKIGVTEYSEMKTTNEKDWVIDMENDFINFSKKKKKQVAFDMVVVVIPLKNGDKIYNALKELCYNKLNVLSQCVKPLSIQKNLKSVCSNLLLQMNAKMGKTTWQV